ncbi:hypothetical protein PHPALM_27827 [Phytophthora palmivora]|uniref:Uncharacterized protein n=1 Tax=Phytophthora palmivora TaxID=4796 RepID=A0A2P4XBM7_9STRA|nr:hypothetical protein PHPALM_27827 [Phytophthora palmivora]
MHEVDVTKQKLSETCVLYELYPADIRNQMKHTITNMNGERTQDSYEMHRVGFENRSCRDDQKALWKYFKKN